MCLSAIYTQNLLYTSEKVQFPNRLESSAERAAAGVYACGNIWNRPEKRANTSTHQDRGSAREKKKYEEKERITDAIEDKDLETEFEKSSWFCIRPHSLS